MSAAMLYELQTSRDRVQLVSETTPTARRWNRTCSWSDTRCQDGSAPSQMSIMWAGPVTRLKRVDNTYRRPRCFAPNLGR